MKKKILIALVIILLIVLIFGMMYLIDRKRMNDNKPVIFSTWGYSYTPPLKVKESNRKTENVKLEIKEGTLTNTGATVIITDKNKNPYGWGEPYFIETNEGGKWTRLKYLSNFAWIEIAYVLDENGQYEQNINWKELYGELPPGNYRLGKNVYDNGYVNFYVEFTIE